MITKQSVICGFLLLSAVAPVMAMQLEASENTSDEKQSGSVAPEVSVPETVENAEMDLSPMAVEPADSEDTRMVDGSIDMSSEQQDPLKKKMTSAQDMSEEMGGEMVPAHSMTEVAPSEEATASMSIEEPAMEDKNDDQEHADVQGVFESMSREEEDEAFPG